MDRIKVNQLIELVKEYGEEMTIGQILEETGRKYVCPICLGKGNLGHRIANKKEPLSAVKGHEYPVLTHLLKNHVDSLGDCTLCEGEGYLAEELIAVETPVITGYMATKPLK